MIPPYLNRAAPSHLTRRAQPPEPDKARNMDVDRLRAACEKIRPALGIAPGLSGSFSIKFEAGRPVFAESKRHLVSPPADAVAELKRALGVPDDYFGSVEVRMDDGAPVLVQSAHSVRLK